MATEPKPVRPNPGVPEGGACWVDWLILALLVIGLVSMLVVAAVG